MKMRHMRWVALSVALAALIGCNGNGSDNDGDDEPNESDYLELPDELLEEVYGNELFLVLNTLTAVDHSPADVVESPEVAMLRISRLYRGDLGDGEIEDGVIGIAFTMRTPAKEEWLLSADSETTPLNLGPGLYIDSDYMAETGMVFTVDGVAMGADLVIRGLWGNPENTSVWRFDETSGDFLPDPEFLARPLTPHFWFSGEGKASPDGAGQDHRYYTAYQYTEKLEFSTTMRAVFMLDEHNAALGRDENGDVVDVEFQFHGSHIVTPIFDLQAF